jgi:hypothetical protein
MGGLSKKGVRVQEKQLKQLRKPCITTRGVHKAELAPPSPSDFELRFGGKLSADNRWVKMVQVIPRSEFESEYAFMLMEL